MELKNIVSMVSRSGRQLQRYNQGQRQVVGSVLSLIHDWIHGFCISLLLFTFSPNLDSYLHLCPNLMGLMIPYYKN
ncbi:hypothetical protein Hanom_Chr09g00813301 [Helianthus anomalus]